VSADKPSSDARLTRQMKGIKRHRQNRLLSVTRRLSIVVKDDDNDDHNVDKPNDGVDVEDISDGADDGDAKKAGNNVDGNEGDHCDGSTHAFAGDDGVDDKLNNTASALIFNKDVHKNADNNDVDMPIKEIHVDRRHWTKAKPTFECQGTLIHDINFI